MKYNRIGGMVALAVSMAISGCAGTPPAAHKGAELVPTSGGPAALGIHHLKFVVSDVDKSLAFYEAAFGVKRVVAMDHRRNGVLFGVILGFPGLGTELELRLDPAAAKTQKGLDPITLTVDGVADLEKWKAHFQAKGLNHSPVLAGLVGWLLVVEDPDGRRVRLYTKQTHGPEVTPSWDSPWVN
ncbi:MAG: lactoylglutathione lyase-like lyase [Ramlibacter sp.]|nr:lactoylglutathione lyase-like lyase [Ramlibacter sp.]